MDTKNKIKPDSKKHFLRNGVCQPPVDTGLPPYSTGLNLFHAVMDSKLAETKLGAKIILGPMEGVETLYKWREFDSSKKGLKKLFIASNKGIKENFASSSRFIEIIVEKSRDKIQLETQITNAKSEIEDYKVVRVEMENFVDKYSVYEKFLRDVAQGSSAFNSVGDILNRYETLEHTRKDCSRLLKEGLEEAAELRKQMAKLVEEKSGTTKQLNNKLVMMQVRRKQAKVKLMYWEHTVEKIKRMIEASEEKWVTLGGACYDLYREICERRNFPLDIHERDIDKQTNFIMKNIMFYKEVITIATSIKQARQAAAQAKHTSLK